MNNLTTAHAPLRDTERIDFLTFQILGLLTSGDGERPTTTEKFEQLKHACHKRSQGIELERDERRLLIECAGIASFIPKH